LTFLDDHSRYVISLTAHTAVTGAIVLEQLRAVMDAYGIPEYTLTDNGPVFTTRDYQPLGRRPGPPKGSPQRGGRKPRT
jgi:transposase InsO family protein